MTNMKNANPSIKGNSYAYSKGFASYLSYHEKLKKLYYTTQKYHSATQAIMEIIANLCYAIDILSFTKIV